MTLPKLIAVVGPTASGKTDLAIALAKRFNGEIISADSRQFYRGTEIGSAVKPGEWKRLPGRVWGGRRTYVAEGVPHHLIGFLSPRRTFTVAQFKDHVIRIVRDVRKRGHLPILCGGTGLFLRAVIDNYDIPEVPADEAFRGRMERLNTEDLYDELRQRDPAYAARIPVNNRRYVIRALEVMHALKRPFSEAQGKGEPLFDTLQLGVRRERSDLNRRIDRRVDLMMHRGLLAEARLLGKRYGWTLPATTGLGHKQLGEHLLGEATLPEAVERIKSDTRRYAKRQMTWFKRDERIKWIRTSIEAIRLVKAFIGRAAE